MEMAHLKVGEYFSRKDSSSTVCFLRFCSSLSFMEWRCLFGVFVLLELGQWIGLRFAWRLVLAFGSFHCCSRPGSSGREMVDGVIDFLDGSSGVLTGWTHVN
jgi:hypothetical protein